MKINRRIDTTELMLPHGQQPLVQLKLGSVWSPPLIPFPANSPPVLFSYFIFFGQKKFSLSLSLSLVFVSNREGES